MKYMLLILPAAVAISGCVGEKASVATQPQPRTAASPYVVEVTARDYRFAAPDSIPSGWITFRMSNAGRMPHFILFQRLPDAVSFEQYLDEVPPAFGVAYAVRDGKITYEQALEKLVADIPPWYWSEVKQMGGNGLASGGVTTETTLYLAPGRYTMECYIKTDEGIFHTDLGMIRELTVTAETANAPEPKADVQIALQNFEFVIDGSLKRGKQVIAATFEEHPQGALGNDIHLVRLDDNTDLDKVIDWMDWLAIDGLRTPAPARFLGGTHEMPVGHTAYFKLDLQPGSYAFIAESAAAKGMVHAFSIE
ncbi:MAG: hypothetical protein KJO54_10095 [Gammaproteobacteria bacterium]|nr:hypothetical protein [Gammaproteobacteria bacterium]NNF62280.1 hypothetical protein [Gammaproteobacteria bacterium]NNM20873.1 hypothetical protein [Gammaproteobacteria bacterium]